MSSVVNSTYVGWSVVDGVSPRSLRGDRFVVKVDQAIKQRFKRGLIYLDVAAEDVQAKITDLRDKGFDSLLVEPYRKHEESAERYINMRRERDGVILSYSRHGGVEIESHAGSIETTNFDTTDLKKVAKATGLSVDTLRGLRRVFDEQYFCLLEVNPYVVDDSGNVTILDAAIEVDSAAESLVDGWDKDDMRSPKVYLSDEEAAAKKLDSESPASFNLELINRDGAIFLLLSGGGASVVIADEIYSLGYGDKLANYGEYSGNPTTHETQAYTAQVLNLLLKSKAKKKAVFIGGAVANFTDIRSTFGGVVNALRERQEGLSTQGVKFYVRRGGPRQAEGLALMERELKDMGLYGGVYDPSVSIPEAIKSVVKAVK